MKELSGICGALCTPFSEDGERLDEKAFRRHIDSMLEAGTHSLLVCGGTGEFAYLREEEKKGIAEIAARHINGKAGFLVQTSAINTKDAIEFAKHAAGTGADCILVLPPYFEGPNADGVFYHYEKISEAVSIPIMAYNIPVHSGFDIVPDFFKRLLEIENIKYIKDSTGDITRIQELLLVCGERAKVFNGADPIAYFSLVAGCAGCVWGAANVMPRQCFDLYELVKANRYEEAGLLWKSMFPANHFFWTHVYNAAIKAATNMCGREVGPCRRPTLPLTQLEIEDLKKALQPLRILSD